MLNRLHAALLFTVITLISCGEVEYDAVDTCRDTYQSILSKRDSTYLPGLAAIQNIEEYVTFVNQHYDFVQENDKSFRKCMKDSSGISSKEETLNWIRVDVGLGGLRYRWGQITENPETFMAENKDNQIHFEHAINLDIDTINRFTE